MKWKRCARALRLTHSPAADFFFDFLHIHLQRVIVFVLFLLHSYHLFFAFKTLNSVDLSHFGAHNLSSFHFSFISFFHLNLRHALHHYYYTILYIYFSCVFHRFFSVSVFLSCSVCTVFIHHLRNGCFHFDQAADAIP